MTPESQSATRPLATLQPNPLNPRGEIDPSTLNDLVASLKAQGILQPLLVTPDGVIVAGHRRYAAAQRAGLDVVPVLVRDLSEREQVEIMLVENIQREDLSPVQEARSYRRLLDAGSTLADMARRIGVTTSRVQARLKLLELDEEVLERFHRLELPLTLCPVLLKVTEPHQQRRLATMAARRTLTAKELDTMIERGLGIVNTRPPRAAAEEQRAAETPKGLSPGRREVLEALRALGDRSIPLQSVADVFERTCCACGLESAPGMCTACPLMDGFRDLQESLARSGTHA